MNTCFLILSISLLGCNDLLGIDERNLMETGGSPSTGGSGGQPSTPGGGGAGGQGAGGLGAGGQLEGGNGGSGGAGGAPECGVLSCDGDCVEPQWDVAHCGQCNHACNAPDSCTAGACGKRLRASNADYGSCVRRADQRLACWGESAYGQLGTGTTFGSGPFSASEVTVLPSSPEPIFAALTPRSTCALLRDGTIRCWGSNEDGQLGIGALGGPEDSLNGTDCCYVTATVAPEFLEEETFIDLVAGGAPWADEYYLALSADGDVYCWGTGATTPVKKTTNITQIAAGGYFACALDHEGQVSCWGSPWGLGDDNRVCDAPVAAMDGLPPKIRLIGAAHIAGFAVDQDDEIYAWGDNRWGSLGPSFTVGVSYYPARVMNYFFPAPVRQITGAHNSACALLTNGDVYCWGHNGMQGDGTEIDGFTVDSLPHHTLIEDVVELEAAHNAFAAIDSTGHVYRWNGFEDLYVPTEVTLP